MLLGGVPETALGPDGVFPKELVETSIKMVDPPVIEVEGTVVLLDVTNPGSVPIGIAMRTVPLVGGAFWLGFHSDGTSQASHLFGVTSVFQYGLKTSLFK